MLTEDQIQYIRLFCSNKGVKYYDLQLELIDHIAKGVEVFLTDNPGTPFVEVVDRFYKSFKTSDLKILVQEKEDLIFKTSLLKMVRGFFAFPKNLIFLFTITLSVLLFYFSGKEFLILFFTICSFSFVLLAAILDLFYFSFFKKPEKPLFSLKISTLQVLILNFCLVSFFLISIHYWDYDTSGFILIKILLFAFALTGTFGVLENCQKVYKKAKKDYPLAFKN